MSIGTTFVIACLILLRVFFDSITEEIDHYSADYSGYKRGYRSEYRKDQTKQGIGNKNTVNTGLRSREQKRNSRTSACAVLAQ